MKNKKWLGLLIAVTMLSIVIGLVDSSASEEGLESDTGTVTRGELVVRTVYEGRLASRNVVSVASRFQGSATVLRMAEEGARVEAGDLLVQFETSESERAVLKYRTEVTLNSAEFEKIVRGEQPMEIMKLSNEIAETRRSLSAEEQYLKDSLELARDELVSAAEVAEQNGKVEALRQRLKALEANLELTRSYLHPMETKRAEATLAAAADELERAQRQVENGTILASSAGVVVYQPLHIAGEYRTVRVGDSVYANQPFLMILDLSDLVIKVAVPEAELGAVSPGNAVLIQPTAYPEVRLAGEVEQVSGIAQSLPDRPAWQRYFRATIGVREGHRSLRPGMSVVAHVVTYHAENALRIPRRAVRFEDGTATTVLVDGSTRRTRELALGPAAETHFEVLDGVDEGDRVLLQ